MDGEAAGGKRDRFERALAAASVSVAWLRMEPAEGMAVRLSLGGEDRLLARAGYHGDPVEWLVRTHS